MQKRERSNSNEQLMPPEITKKRSLDRRSSSREKSRSDSSEKQDSFFADDAWVPPMQFNGLKPDDEVVEYSLGKRLFNRGSFVEDAAEDTAKRHKTD